MSEATLKNQFLDICKRKTRGNTEDHKSDKLETASSWVWEGWICEGLLSIYNINGAVVVPVILLLCYHGNRMWA